MRLQDLSNTLKQAHQTQQIGEAVSFRAHLQLSNATSEVDQSIAAIMSLAGVCFDIDEIESATQSSHKGRQTTMLGTTKAGRSVMITVGAGSAKIAQFHLLVLGNHGSIELDGGHLFDESAWLASLAT